MGYLPGEAFNALTVWLGVECVYWRGLDTKELDLPLDEAFGVGLNGSGFNQLDGPAFIINQTVSCEPEARINAQNFHHFPI